MKRRILFSAVGAILLALATTAGALAWPEQPPTKVLISGPGLVGEIQVNDEQALAIFRVGNLEDMAGESSEHKRGVAGRVGYSIIRYFDGGTFDFARLTYYPNPSGGRGDLFFEDGPMIQGDHTPYDQTWLQVKPAGEQKLRALLRQLGATLGDAEPAPRSATVNVSTTDSPPPGNATLASQTSAAQKTSEPEPSPFSSTDLALLAGVTGVLVAAGAGLVWLASRRHPLIDPHRAVLSETEPPVDSLAHRR